MNIRERASEFSIYVFAGDIDHGAGVKVALAQAGYDAFFFEDRDRFFSRLTEKPPHLVIFPTDSAKPLLSDFVESLLKASPETKFIMIAKPVQTESLASYGAYGLLDIITDESVGLASRAVFAVDRACERIYLSYQNEQLIDQLEIEKERALRAEQVRMSGPIPEQKGPPLDDRIKDYRSAGTKEDLLRRFMQIMGSTSCVFLKYLPTVRSLVVTHSSVLDADQLQGVGCQLLSEEARDFGTQVALGVVAPSLERVLLEALRFEEPRLLPLFVQGRLDGVIAYSTRLSEDQRHRLHDEFSLLALAYSNFALEIRVDQLETQDLTTEVPNRKFYATRLREEWSRARRIQLPLCVVKVALDDFFELEQALGEAARDALLKNVAQLIVKTSRTNDITARTGLNEFAMLLPHCDRQGAMIRAERLRRIVESSQMVDNGLKVSISLGISEYPSLCSTAEGLDETSTKALAHIMDKGGNRLCLFKAPSDHQPEFAVVAGAGQGST